MAGPEQEIPDLASLGEVERVTIEYRNPHGGKRQERIPSIPQGERTLVPDSTRDFAGTVTALAAGGAATIFAPGWVNGAEAVLADSTAAYAIATATKYVRPTLHVVAAIPGGIRRTWRERRGSKDYIENRPRVEPTPPDPSEIQQHAGSGKVRTGAKVVFSLGAGLSAAKFAPHWINAGEDVIVSGAGLATVTVVAVKVARSVGRFLGDIPNGVRKALKDKRSQKRSPRT